MIVEMEPGELARRLFAEMNLAIALHGETPLTGKKKSDFIRNTFLVFKLMREAGELE